VAILVHDDVSVSLTLLIRNILLRTNLLLEREHFAVSLIGASTQRDIVRGDVTIRLRASGGPSDYLIVPPLTAGRDPFRERTAETRLIARSYDQGTVVCAACLGALLVAQAGLLGGRSATTHWAWVQRAKERLPAVKWDASRMVCDAGSVVTAGGFLAAVDLTLAIVERECSRQVSHEVGRLLLADSARQHQSLYATRLIDTTTEEPRLRRLERWLTAHLSEPISVDDMARVCRLEPRTFRRLFASAYGMSPKKLLQLKRVETVRSLLRRSDLSIEEIVARVGVTDVPSFRRIFQRELGLSPAEYRRRLVDRQAAPRTRRSRGRAPGDADVVRAR